MAELAPGIDVSHWQSGLHLASTDAKFAIFKATDGTNFVDNTCDNFVSQAKAMGIPWGTYHFAQNTGNMTAEADFYLKHVGGYVGHGILVLDWEHGNLGNVSGAKAFLDRVYAKTGVRPLIYMSQSVAASYNWDSVQRDYALWVARYNDTIGSTGGWPVTMWQYTNAHHTGGWAVDGDRFYGSRATWDAFATGDEAPEPDPTPPEDEMPDFNLRTADPDQTVQADEQWHTIKIGDADDPTTYNLVGPGFFTADVFMGVQAGHAREVDVRAIQVDIRDGDVTVHAHLPAQEFRTGGGTTQIGYSVSGQVKTPAAGVERRVRIQVRAYQPSGAEPTITIGSVNARALVWK